MSSPWLFAGSPDRIGADAVSLMEGTTFCVSDPRGDIHDGLREGLFVRDTRLLSRWELLVDEVRPDPLSVHQDAPFCATFLSHVSGATRGRSCATARDRYVGNGMREDISVRNTAGRPVAVAVRLLLAADFADVFDVKDGTARMPAGVRVSTGSTTLDLSIESGGREYAVSVSPTTSQCRTPTVWPGR